jgi:hypothetical protein
MAKVTNSEQETVTINTQNDSELVAGTPPGYRSYEDLVAAGARSEPSPCTMALHAQSSAVEAPGLN